MTYKVTYKEDELKAAIELYEGLNHPFFTRVLKAMKTNLKAQATRQRRRDEHIQAFLKNKREQFRNEDDF